jgi:hypothetical protein
MPPKPATKFNGPGHWRSQAEAARGLQGNVFAELAEMHRRLLDRGLTDAAAKVEEAVEQARAGFTDKASDTLREAAGLLHHSAGGHAQGLREIGERVAGTRPGTTIPAAEEELPGMTDS